MQIEKQISTAVNRFNSSISLREGSLNMAGGGTEEKRVG